MNPQIKRTVIRYALDDLISLLESAGIPCQRNGKEIDADFEHSGHYRYKLNPAKGVYFSTDGEKGTIAQLLRKHKIDAGNAKATQTSAKPKDNSSIARQVWMQGWTCTHGQDMPAGWDRGMTAAQKGAQRVQLEQERDAVLAYLTARLGPEHLTHWLRQVRIARDRNGCIMMLVPMYQQGIIVGVQRTYLTPDGAKVERKMLGRKGVLALTPPWDVTPVKLGDDTGYKIIGTGFETVGAVIQEDGWAGLVTFDDGGLIQWAENQAKMAEDLTPDQLAKAPTCILLADRDISGSGQNAAAKAVKILRKVGLKAYFALPPSNEDGGPKGGPKGSDWGDYPQENLSHALVAHLQMAIMNGDKDMPEPETDDQEAERIFDFKGFRPGEAQEPAKPVRGTVEVEAVRSELMTDLQKIVKEYVHWINAPEDQRNHFSPFLEQITTGVGKSHLLKKLPLNPSIRLSGGRVVVSVQNHEQAGEFDGFFHFWGRQPDESRCSDALCQAHEHMQQAQEREHVAQAEFCSKCPHGLVWAIGDAKRQLDEGDLSNKRRDDLESRIDAHTAELHRHGLEPGQVEPCRWQSHLRDAMNEQFVVMVHQSYSHAVVNNALYITDESFDIGKTVTVTLQDVSQWAAQNNRVVQRLEQSQSADHDDAKDLERHRQAGQFLEALARRMAEWAGRGKTGNIDMDADLVRTIQSLLDAARGRVSLAAWEKLSFGKDGHMEENPLRAAFALAESLQIGGSAFVQNGALVVAASNPVVERIRDGLPTVLMDATPPKAIRDIVIANDGQILRRIAHQNVRIIRHPARFWGLSALKEKKVGADRVSRELFRYQTLATLYPDAAMLIHKQAFDLLPDGFKANPLHDYWGMGHRAQNRMTGNDLTIAGSFFPPQDAWQALYTADRLAALAGGAEPDSWPVYPNEMPTIDGIWINENGPGEVQCRLPLPADPQIRAWLLDKIVSETVQAVGRARGANAEREITVRIFGGVPLAGLGEHGLAVAEYQADPAELGQIREQVNGERHEAAMIRMDQAASRVVSQGRVLTYSAMAEAMQSTGTDAFYRHSNSPYTKPVETKSHHVLSFSTYQKWLARIQSQCPAIAHHLSQTGRGAAVVRVMIEANRKYGQESLKYAVEMTEALVKQGKFVLWDTLDDLDGAVLDQDCLPGTKALQKIMAAILGCDAGPPVPD